MGLLVGSILGWSAAGLAALFVARIAYTLITPFDVKKELLEDRNLAVGISQGLFLLAAAIILHGVIEGERMPVAWWYEFLFMGGLYLAGIGLLGIGRLVLRLLAGFDLDHEIHENDNPAVGVLEGCSYIGFAIIIHSTL
jgi:uncharacterized membrane protein YjfL (UPF0719 family)